MNDRKLFEVGIEFHGHKCPAMPLGIRAGMAAMEKLGVERASNKELFCFCESGPVHATMCFVDGVQVATGCTYGKGNILRLDYGKNAITLVDVKSKRAVRVSVNPDFQIKGLSSEFVSLRRKGVQPNEIAPEIVDPLIDRIISAPVEDILDVGDVKDIDFRPKRGFFYWERCENCGEVVFAPGLRVRDGKTYCIPCFGME